MAEAKKNILTPDGLKALEDELQELKVVRRKEIAQQGLGIDKRNLGKI